MPRSLEAERSILSSMMQDANLINVSQEKKLKSAHFYLPAHRILFEILLEFSDKGQPVELISLKQTIEDRSLLEDIGGYAALVEIYASASTNAHFDYHLNIVLDKFILRSVIQTCTDSIKQAYEDQEAVDTLLDKVEQDVLQIREGSLTEEKITTKAAVAQVIEEFEQFLANPSEMQGLKTGYQDLDMKCNGLKGGDMFIIAARPSMGKTSFVMNIVEHVCLDQKRPAMVFSCEMPVVQLVHRLLFSRARVNLSKLRAGLRPTQRDFKAITQSGAQISESKLIIDDTASISINELRAKARRRHREDGIELIAVDYLQLMRSEGRQAENSREREVAQISAGLKALAKELNIPIIVLAQLNRGPESRTGSSHGKPKMSDLRESGSIEQDADMVGLLYREAYYVDADDKEKAEEVGGKSTLVLAKNRNGETGDIPLTFLPEFTRFEARAREADE